MLAIVDTGPLYAVVDEDDADHARCREVLEEAEHRLIIPALVQAARCGASIRSWQQTERLSMPGANGTEVPIVQRDDGLDIETLRQRNDGRIGPA